MASVEREPIMGVQEQSHWSGVRGGKAPLKLKAF